MKKKLEIVEIVKEFRFEAAHKLINVPIGHKCGRLHGHSFRLSIKLRGTLDPKNFWVMDFADVTKIVKSVIDQHLDHYYLNDIVDLGEPTSEALAIWLWNKLKPLLTLLYELTISETCTSSCIYRGEKE